MGIAWARRPILSYSSSLVHHSNPALHLGIQRRRITGNEWRTVAYYCYNHWHPRVDCIPRR